MILYLAKVINNYYIMIIRYLTAFVIIMLASELLSAQPVRNELNVPDIPGYVTLKGDFQKPDHFLQFRYS
jgi:hypothetical protein